MSEQTKMCRPLACNAQPKSFHIIQSPAGGYFQYEWVGTMWAYGITPESLTQKGYKYVCPHFYPDMFSITQTLRINEMISHLHEANNREVEAHRATKAQLRQLQAAFNKLVGLS